jgi:methionyl-tRNA formyltransferase
VLAAGLDVAGLVTAPPRKAGRGRKEAPNPLADAAEAKGIPVLRPESARDPEFQQAFRSWEVDLGVVVSYGQLLDQSLLDIPKFGCVNLHGSLLPRWRGASPVQAAILAGDAETGVCLQKMVLALDAGDVLAQMRVPLRGDEVAPVLFERLAEEGATFLAETLAGFEKLGRLPDGLPQEKEAVTVCRKIKKEDGVLDWKESVEAIDRRVRAMAGWPCGQTTLPDGSGLRVHEGVIAEKQTTAIPGTILSLEDGLTVACGSGSFRITSLQKEGKARLDASSFLAGARLEVGQEMGR